MMHFCHEDFFILANSADTDEMSTYVAFHLGINCLPKYLFAVVQNETGKSFSVFSKSALQLLNVLWRHVFNLINHLWLTDFGDMKHAHNNVVYIVKKALCFHVKDDFKVVLGSYDK